MLKSLFDYSLFLKEPNYTYLLACLGIFKRTEKVEAIFQILINYEIHPKTFIMDNTGANNKRIYVL